MTALIDGVGHSELLRVCDLIEARAADLDRGATDVRSDIGELGRAGLFDFGVHTAGLDHMVTVIEEISAKSLAAGFSVWAQRMTVEYLHRAPGPLRERHLDSLASGRRIGVTAMAAGLKQVAGLGQVPVIAEPDGDDLVVTGPIRWASNVFPESLIVLPARSDDGRSYIVVTDANAGGVTINRPPDLMGLGATASTSLDLDHVRIARGSVLSTDLTRFVTSIRPTFLLLQTAFCAGIGRAAMAAAEPLLTGLGEQFRDEDQALRSEHRHVAERLFRFASDPTQVSVRDLVRLRLDGSAVAVAATRLESTLRGGAGYATSSPANRRFREASFLPIQSPSEGQLRWELKQYE